MAHRLKVEKREDRTQSQLKELRKNGKIPAVVYGESIHNASIAVGEKELIALLKSNPNAILQIDLPEQGNCPVMVNDIQRDPLSRNILHIDLQQINEKHPVKAPVRIDFTGKPKGVEAGGILQTRMNELDIECLPHLIPTHISVDVSDLNIGETILVSDVKVADDIKVWSEASNVLASVLAPQKEETIEEAAEDDSSEEEIASEESASKEAED